MKSFLLLLGLLLLISTTGATRLPLDGVIKVLHALLTKGGGNQRLGEEGEVNQFDFSPSFSEVFWQLQKILADNLNDHGLRPKRSTDGSNPDWDKELDLLSFGKYGILLQLKHLDHPAKGARVHMNLSGPLAMLRNTCDKCNKYCCGLPHDLEVDLMYDRRTSRITIKSKEKYEAENGPDRFVLGGIEMESKVEGGVYTLKFVDFVPYKRNRVTMTLEWPLFDWSSPDKTTVVQARLKSDGPVALSLIHI